MMATLFSILNFISQYHRFSETKCGTWLVLTNCLSRELWIPILSLTFVLTPLNFPTSTNTHSFVYGAVFKNTLSPAGPVTVSVSLQKAGSTLLIHSRGRSFEHYAAPLAPARVGDTLSHCIWSQAANL